MTRNSLAWSVTTVATSSKVSGHNLDAERRLCISVSRRAARICVNSARVCVRTKADASPVTAADVAIQATLERCLEEAFPNDQLIGEEDTHSLLADAGLRDAVQQLVDFDVTATVSRAGQARTKMAGGRFWTIDPIDGTKGFLSNEGFAVGIALLEHGRGGDAGKRSIGYPRLGALALPRKNVVLLGDTVEQRYEEICLDESPNAGSDGNANEDGRQQAGRPRTTCGADRGSQWFLSGAKDLADRKSVV